MRKLIVAGIVLVLLLGGFIVYMEIDKRKFIDSISSASRVVDQPVNGAETTIEDTQENKKPKFQEVDTDELLAAVNRIPEQFGYSEASTTYAKLETKLMSREELTIDERVAYTEAMLYLYPSEIYPKIAYPSTSGSNQKVANFPEYDGFSDEDIAELKDLGISVVYRGDAMIINPHPDYIRRDLAEEDADEEPSDPASDAVFSEGIGEDTDLLPARSEGMPIMPEPKPSVATDHVHHGDRHVHEPPTPGHGTDIQPPTLAPAKSVEARGWMGLSQEQREEAKQLFNRYGTAEGLRRLRETDPDAAAQFDWERREPPVPSESDEESSTR